MKLLKTLLVFFMLGFVSLAQSQTVTLSGSVFSLSTTLQVPNHAVYFSISGVNDTVMTQTDEEGFFAKEIEITAQDSFLVIISTLDPCTSEWHYKYYLADHTDEFIEFTVCDVNEEPDSCMAAFDYYIEYANDSVNYENDSINEGLLTVFFYDQTLGQANQWAWDFGDGTTSDLQSPIHTYATEGQYEVTLAIVGETCESNTAQVLYLGDTIGDYCAALFSFDFAYDVDSIDLADSLDRASYQVLFYDFSIGNPTQWYWSFGDGTTSNEQNPVHNYATDGEYLVSLMMVSEECSDSIAINVSIGNVVQDCYAYYLYDYVNWIDSIMWDSSEIDMQTLYFYDASEGDTQNWHWDFGDGSSSVLQNPTHTYAEPGDYVVSLKIAGNDCESQYEDIVWVGNAPADTLWGEDCFAMFFPVNLENNTVEFINDSNGEMNEYTWDFGDGTSSTEMNPVHTYNEEGEYLVSLAIASDSACNSMVEMYVWVGDYSSDSTLVALFVPEFNGNSVTFRNKSQGDAYNFHWDFGDENTDKTENPVHVYAEKGSYTVTLGIGSAEAVSTFTMEIDLEEETYVGYFPNGTTSVKEETQVENMKVFPMPIGNTATLTLNCDKNTSATLLLSNIEGKLISQQNIILASGLNTFDIDASKITTGIYFVQIRMLTGERTILKIVK